MRKKTWDLYAPIYKRAMQADHKIYVFMYDRIKEEFKRTDWFVKHIYVPKGFFTSPFETKDSLKVRLETLYSEVEVAPVRSEGVFRCVK